MRYFAFYATAVIAAVLLSAGVSASGPMQGRRTGMEVTRGLNVVVLAYETDPSAPTFEAKWESGGVEMKVTTPRRTNEGAANQARRHRIGVDALKREFPPDPIDPSVTRSSSHVPIVNPHGRTGDRPPVLEKKALGAV